MFKILDYIAFGIIYAVLFIPVNVLLLINFMFSKKDRDSFLEHY